MVRTEAGETQRWSFSSRLVVLILKANYKYPPVICLLIQSGGGFVQCVSAESWVLCWGEAGVRVH